MIHDPQDAAAQVERRRMRAALADLKRLKQRRRPPAPSPPAETPFKYVPASFIADIDWDAADRAPGPEAVAASPPPTPPELEYEGVLEKMDFFLKEFDWQDEPDGAATSSDAAADRQPAGDSFGWEENPSSASAGAPPPLAEAKEEAVPPPTTDGVFTNFQWE